MKKKIIATLILAVFLLSTNAIITLAVTQSDIQNKVNEINENKDKINEAKDKQDEIGEKINEANKQIQTLTSQITQYQNQIDELDSELSDLEDSISEAEDKIEEAEKKYNEQEEMLQARIVAQYEAGETTYLDVILGGGSLWDMVSNWYLVSEIADKDNELLEQIEENKNEIEEAKKSLETNKTQVETLKNNKEQTAKALKNSQAQKEKQVSELNEEDKLLQEQIDELNAANEKASREEEELRRQYQAQIDGLNNGTTKPSGGGSSIDLGGSGIFQRPVQSGVITATMYYSSGVYHGALDYGVPIGTTVYAAGDGVVLNATYRAGGLGNCVVIQHANGLRTYYGHGNGKFYVSPGDVVAKGQPIMLSGNTGNSSGPHLHFEVRVSPYSWVYGGGAGDCRRDPRNYL